MPHVCHRCSSGVGMRLSHPVPACGFVRPLRPHVTPVTLCQSKVNPLAAAVSAAPVVMFEPTALSSSVRPIRRARIGCTTSQYSLAILGASSLHHYLKGHPHICPRMQRTIGMCLAWGALVHEEELCHLICHTAWPRVGVPVIPPLL